MTSVFGNNFANLLLGANGPDDIFGFGGNDTLVGGSGADHLHGDGGIDTASYATSLAAVQVDLSGVNRHLCGEQRR